MFQWLLKPNVDRSQRFSHALAQFKGRGPPNHRGHVCHGSLFDPDRALIANTQGIKPLFGCSSKGIAYKIFNGGEHSRHHIRILVIRRPSAYMVKHQSRSTMDEKDLFDLIDQCMEKDDFRIGPMGTQGLEPPLQSLDGETVVEQLIERLNHAHDRGGDRPADTRPHQWENRIGQDLGILANGITDRIFDGRPQSTGNTPILIQGQGDCIGKNMADLFCPRSKII